MYSSYLTTRYNIQVELSGAVKGPEISVVIFIFYFFFILISCWDSDLLRHTNGRCALQFCDRGQLIIIFRFTALFFTLRWKQFNSLHCILFIFYIYFYIRIIDFINSSLWQSLFCNSSMFVVAVLGINCKKVKIKLNTSYL